MVKIKSGIPLSIEALEKDNYHVFVDAKIGRKKARLMLDTGASKTVFDQERILQFDGLTENKSLFAESMGLGAEMLKTGLTEIGSIKFGEIKLRKVTVAVLSLSHVNDAYKNMGIRPIDGILGSDLLFQLKAVINYKLKKLVLSM
jgi:predicted aspartyl protease